MTRSSQWIVLFLCIFAMVTPCAGKPTREEIIALTEKCKNEKQQMDLVAEFGKDFSGLDLSGIDFRGYGQRGFETQLLDANFSNCNLQGADFGSTRMDGANFTEANLEKASFAGAKCHFTQADFSRANLTRANLIGAKLNQARFDGTVLRDADLSNAQLIQASFTGADLTGASFQNAIIDSAVFTGAIGLDDDERRLLELKAQKFKQGRAIAANQRRLFFAGYGLTALLAIGLAYPVFKLSGKNRSVAVAAIVNLVVLGPTLFLFIMRFAGASSTVQFNAGNPRGMNFWSMWVDLAIPSLLLLLLCALISIGASVAFLVTFRKKCSLVRVVMALLYFLLTIGHCLFAMNWVIKNFPTA